MDSGANPGLAPTLTLFWPLFVLCIGSGALYLLLYLGRLRAKTRSPKNAPVACLSRVELSPQHVLYVVEAQNRCLLLGGAPGGLSVLCELDRPLVGKDRRLDTESPVIPKDLAA